MIDIKERPIIFNAQEVNAVLAGDKTQYRVPFDFEFKINTASLNETADDIGWSVQKLITRAYHEAVYDFECPFGKVGDRLWVREFHARREFNDPLIGTHYYADGPLTLDLRHDAGLLIKYAAENMPRWASRILLEITDIRIERVQDTSHDDAVAEGVYNFDIEAQLRDQALSVAQIVFSRHWDSKYQEHCVMWEDNPWVWVIESKVLKPASDIQSNTLKILSTKELPQ